MGTFRARADLKPISMKARLHLRFWTAVALLCRLGVRLDDAKKIELLTNTLH